MDGGRENIDANQREIAPGLSGLLFQPDHLAGLVKLGDTELARVRHLGQHDLSVRTADPDLLDQRADPADDEVIPQIHDEIVITEILACDQDRMSQPARRILPEIRGTEPEGAAVADRFLDRRRSVPHHDPDVGDAGIADGLKTVEQDRLVRDGNQLLGGRVGDRAEPAPRPPRQDQGLHDGAPSAGSCRAAGGVWWAAAAEPRVQVAATAAVSRSPTVITTRDTRATAVAAPAPIAGPSIATSSTSRTPAPAGANTTRKPAHQAKAKAPVASSTPVPSDRPTRVASSHICRP